MTGAQSVPSQSLSYDGGEPALLFGCGDAAVRTADLLGSAGYRLVGQEPLADASARLDRQAAVSLVWLECSGPAAVPTDALLDQLARLAESGAAAVVACAPQSLIDPLFAALDHPAAQILIDPDEMDRAAAVSLALAGAGRSARVSDVGRDNAVRLRQLSDEMGRIASTLARLSSTPDESGGPVLRPAEPAAELPPLGVATVRSVIRARRLRARYFAEELFADPAWDMLLDLLQAEIAQHRVPVSSLCIAAAVPATTALRWIKSMTDSGLFVRRADPHDGRRVFVELSSGASEAMRRYFAELGPVAVAA